MNTSASTMIDSDELQIESPRIGNRLALALIFAFVTGAIVFATGSWMMKSLRDGIVPQYKSALLSEAHARRDALERYYNSAAYSLVTLADPIVSRQMLAEFSAGFTSMGSTATEQLRKSYITNNPNPIGNKQALIAAPDNTAYSSTHKFYHQWLTEFATQNDFYDVFLISADGNVLYTVFKEDDFGTNLTTGAYKDTALGRLFLTISEDSTSSEFFFSDFAPYEPSNFQMSAFIGAPILIKGKMAGVVMAQINPERISRAIQSAAGFEGDTTASLVGADHILRIGTDIPARGKVNSVQVWTESVQLALRNQAGALETQDQNGTDVLSAHLPLTFDQVQLALIVDQKLADLYAPLHASQKRLGWMTLLAALIAFGIGWALADRGRPTSES